MQYGLDKTESCKNKQIYFFSDKSAFLDKENAALYLDFR